MRFYDLGGVVVYRPALILVQLSNETTTTVMTKIAEVAGIGLTLGSGALAGLGVRATLLARVVLIADRVAFVLGTVATILHEHRGEILARFPQHGPAFVRALEYVQSATAMYGFARVAIELPRIVLGLRSTFRNWQAERSALQSELTASERQVVQSLDRDVADTLDQADAIRAARDPATPAGAMAHLKSSSRLARVRLIRLLAFRGERSRRSPMQTRRFSRPRSCRNIPPAPGSRLPTTRPRANGSRWRAAMQRWSAGARYRRFRSWADTPMPRPR